MPTFYEFFAGGGMARAGLGEGWECLFANDFDHKKCRSYRANWGGDQLLTDDIRTLGTKDLPGSADLAWASFPCQDLSLAGSGAGLKGDRSGTFWPFWKLVTGLMKEGRAPRLVVLENVCGALTSHEGRDFTAICSVFAEAGYRVGALVIDASLFVPQSRQRLFVVGTHADMHLPAELLSCGPSPVWHPGSMVAVHTRFAKPLQSGWVWWHLPLPPARSLGFADIIEENPASPPWFTRNETERLLAMMSDVNRAKVEAARRVGKRVVGTVYKRTRLDENGVKTQRAEVRFDNVSGCLRTPAGGSSRQLIIVVEGESVRIRLISGRETARLMGLSDNYKLPDSYNEAYHLTGDGVVVPVVRHLAQHLLEPVLTAPGLKKTAAA